MTRARSIMRNWFAEERPDGCYVVETQPGKRDHIRFGPMPQEWVLAVISERRTMVETMMKRLGQDLTPHTC